MEIDELLSKINTMFTQVIHNPNTFHIKNYPKWGSWNNQLSSMLKGYESLYNELAKCVTDPKQERIYNEWQWNQVINAIQALTPNPTLCKTNWNNLCEETAAMCIDKMDLETRKNLRAASHTEKKLVDKAKISLESVELEIGRGAVIKVDDGSLQNHQFSMRTLPWETIMRNLIHFLNTINTVKVFTVLDETVLGCYTDREFIISELAKCTGFKCSTFDAYFRFNPKISTSLLVNCVKKLETLNVQNKTRREIYQVFLALPQVADAKVIKFSNCGRVVNQDLNIFLEVPEKWIEEDAPVGKQIAYHGNKNKIMPEFIKKFKDRRVSNCFIETPLSDIFSTYRIRMNDPSKHIIMEEAVERIRSPCQRYCTIVDASYVCQDRIL